jgi:hypothetical protein
LPSMSQAQARPVRGAAPRRDEHSGVQGLLVRVARQEAQDLVAEGEMSMKPSDSRTLVFLLLDVERLKDAHTPRSAQSGILTPHTCHAIGCAVGVRPELLMCGRHWAMVPSEIRRAVWSFYRAGQCVDKRPSPAWLVAARSAIAKVAVLEGRMNEDAAIRFVAELFGPEGVRRAMGGHAKKGEAAK